MFRTNVPQQHREEQWKVVNEAIAENTDKLSKRI